jgi:hypothetical protein
MPWSTMSAAGLHKWSGIDQSQNGRDASQDYFQDSGPGHDVAGGGKPSQNLLLAELNPFENRPFLANVTMAKRCTLTQRYIELQATALSSRNPLFVNGASLN